MADSLERGQAELERSNAELKRSNAELEQFASVTSHDLQAPLTTISMYAELLERRHGPEPDGGHDLINGIRGATTQARTLIRDLLEYSRAGRGDLSVEPLPSELVVNQALEALAGSIESTGARVQVGSLPVVLADRSNLCRVFQNLIGNAVKFTRGDDPEVVIEAERDGRALALSRSATTASAWTPRARSASSSRFAACTARRPIRGPASASPSASASSSSTAAGSGSRASPARAASSRSRCRPASSTRTRPRPERRRRPSRRAT